MFVYIEIVDSEGRVVHRIDSSDKSKAALARLEYAVARRIDPRYYTRQRRSRKPLPLDP